MPPSHDKPLSEQTAQLLTRGAIIVACVVPAFAALQHFHYGATRAAIACLVGALLMTSTGVVHRRWLRADIYLGSVVFLMISFVSYFRGGMVGPILVWTIGLPTAAALLGRSRGALIWLGLWGLQFLALMSIERAGLAPPRVDASVGGVLGGYAGAAAMLVLATMVMNRMRERAERETEAAMRQLHRANKIEAIARLAGGVAHDFNNLLAVISAHARIVSREIDVAHGCQDDLEAIEAATERGAALTRRLLAIGREDEVSNPVAFDVNHVMEDVVKLLESALPESVALEVHLSERPLVVEADPKRLHQAAMNLAFNARDALRDVEGERRVVLTTELRGRGDLGEEGEPEWVVLTVADTGVGMSEEVIGNLFEPFFTTKERAEGSGLGLAVVRGIVTRLGGTVEVESKEGRGTAMRVVLPRSHAEPAWPLAQPRSRVEVKRHLTVLLVEDDRAVRKATRRLLTLDGHDVIEAEDGSVALELLEQRGQEVDVVLTDVVMPIMSGPQMVRELRRQWPDLFVIYMSGYAGDELEGNELALDKVLFVQKPVSRDDFRRAFAAVGESAAEPAAE